MRTVSWGCDNEKGGASEHHLRGQGRACHRRHGLKESGEPAHTASFPQGPVLESGHMVLVHHDPRQSPQHAFVHQVTQEPHPHLRVPRIHRVATAAGVGVGGGGRGGPLWCVVV